MAEAAVGDDVLGDDPTVTELQDYAAGLLGKEAGLYFPSGTQCNQAAVRALTQRGDEVFLHAQAHIIFFEQGARIGAQPCSSAPSTRRTARSIWSRWRSTCTPTTTCTSRARGWCAWRTRTTTAAAWYCRWSTCEAVRAFCDRHGLSLHLDGARLFNAAVASGCRPRDYAALSIP